MTHWWFSPLHSWFGCLQPMPCAVKLSSVLLRSPGALLFRDIFNVTSRLCSSNKHHVAYAKGHVVCPDIFSLSLEMGQWQWEVRRASLCKWWWSEMYVRSAGQGHADSDLCLGLSPQSPRQIWSLLLTGCRGVKNVHQDLCSDWVFATEQSCACSCKRDCLQSCGFLQNPQLEEISSQQLPYTNLCLSLFIPSGFSFLIF